MINFEFECWKCGEWHSEAVDTEQELKELTELMGVAIRLVP